MTPPRIYEIGNQRKTLRAWSDFYGRPLRLVKQRVGRGWNLLEALETPKSDLNGRLTVGKITRTWRAWSKISGFSVKILRQRERWGWPPERIVSPFSEREKLLTIGDRTQSISAWVREKGIGRKTYYERLARGMPPEAAMCAPTRYIRKEKVGQSMDRSK